MALLSDDVGGVRTLLLSNPTKRNALTRETLEALRAAVAHPPSFAEVGSRSGRPDPVRTSTRQGDADWPRVFVLGGDPAGGAFSSGFFIGDIDDDERARGLDPIGPPASALERSAVNVIAGIDGACMGGALEIALSCTLRVASQGARFAMPPARLGLVYSASGLERFARALSPSQMQRLFLTAEPIDAQEALRIGLVDVLCESDALGAARAMAHRIEDNAPLAVRGLLDAIRRTCRPGGLRDDDRDAIAAARNATVGSDDLAEGVRAFAEKRAPRFVGR